MRRQKHHIRVADQYRIETWPAGDDAGQRRGTLPLEDRERRLQYPKEWRIRSGACLQHPSAGDETLVRASADCPPPDATSGAWESARGCAKSLWLFQSPGPAAGGKSAVSTH